MGFHKATDYYRDAKGRVVGARAGAEGESSTSALRRCSQFLRQQLESESGSPSHYGSAFTPDMVRPAIRCCCCC